ncbi:MAG: aldehyde dehydrogenase family protein [Deltaproteobacteria bacterium]|nr:aldehyde dehydrogenase family protein [Deltaproteobacteria bacterium]
MGTLNQPIIDHARAAQKEWAAVSITERARWLKKFQKLIVKKQDEIIAAIREDTKKPAIEALGIEIATVLMTADYYRKKAKKFLKPRRAQTHWMFKNKGVRVLHVPHGVVGILGPSNLPFSLTIGDAIPALMAGNAVVVKPSEHTPKSAEVGAKLAAEAGLPAGLLQIIQGGGEVGGQLIEQVDCIFFTGSTAVGRKVAAKAGELLKPCILELGGKAPMIVLEDADLARAARACVWGRFAHSGQHCIAVERVYVDQRIAPAFLDEVVRLAQELNPQNLSPLTAPKTAQHIKELKEEALTKGAKIMEPGILTNVNHTMRVMKEESFGPLLPIMAFGNEAEALKLANDSTSGLSAVIFSRDRRRALRIAKQVESGNVSVNDVMDHFMIMDAPFGGWKLSGLGVRHSREGLLQFTRPQTIFWHRFSLPIVRHREFWWFPYTAWAQKLTRRLIRFFFG